MAEQNNSDFPDKEISAVYMGPPRNRGGFPGRLRNLFKKADAPKKTYPQSFADEEVPEKTYPQSFADEGGEADGPAGNGAAAVPEEMPDLEEVYMGPPLPEPELEEVYMGPPLPEPDEEPESPMTRVYAGPARDLRIRRDRGPRTEALYAAPVRPQASEMRAVYAGPAYFRNRAAGGPGSTPVQEPNNKQQEESGTEE